MEITFDSQGFSLGEIVIGIEVKIFTQLIMEGHMLVLYLFKSKITFIFNKMFTPDFREKVSKDFSNMISGMVGVRGKGGIMGPQLLQPIQKRY